MIQKGIIPAHVDLTPAMGQTTFPLHFEPSRFYHPDEYQMRRDISAGAAASTSNVKFDQDIIRRRVEV